MTEWKLKNEEIRRSSPKEDIRKIIESNTGKTVEEVTNTKYTDNISCFVPETGELTNLEEACKFLEREKDRKITIMADYDADGVCSATILYLFLKSLGISDFKVRFPKRFSEGYGLSMNVIDETGNDELIITVDNGIAAVEEIKAAKEKGIKVLILDHHLKGEEYPEADMIVDPEAVPGSDFNGYCGAGLAYLFAKKYYQLFDKGNVILEDTMETYAGIATVCDVMDIIGPNYQLVKNSLYNIKTQKCRSVGLYKLMEELRLDYNYLTEMDYGFSIGPCINAAGRLHDDGPEIPFKLFTAFNETEASSLAKWIVENNTVRKDAVKVLSQEAYENVEFNRKAIVYKMQEPATGINGIIAGRVAEKSNKPTFICSPSENDPNILKGSARTGDNINLKKLMDKAVKLADKDDKTIFLGYGGHAGAAGFALKPEYLEDLMFYLEKALENHEFPEKDIKYYDLEINNNQLEDYMEAIKFYAPFGQGNPRPVFKINRILCKPTQKGSYVLMGKDQDHIKIYGSECDLIGFGKSEDFVKTLGSKDLSGLRIKAYGSLSENVFRDNVTLQLETLDIEKEPVSETKAQRKLSEIFNF